MDEAKSRPERTSGDCRDLLMATPERKPPAPMQSRDNRLSVRLTDDERAGWDAAARHAGEEVSRYFRRCARIGRKVLEAGIGVEATGA